MIYLDFLYIPLDYYSTLTRKEKIFEICIPALIAISSCILELRGYVIQLRFIEKFIPYAEILLGFILTALSVLVSSDKFRNTASKFPSGRSIRNVPVSLYRTLIAEFSYVILISALIITAYFIAQAIPFKVSMIVAVVMNGLFIILSFNLLFSTIRVISNLYFTQCKT